MFNLIIISIACIVDQSGLLLYNPQPKVKFMNYLSLLLASMISTHTYAQVTKSPLLIEESRRVLGDGSATDLKPKALEELYHQARISDWGVKQGFKSGKTILLEQEYVVFPFDSNTPTKIKRKVALNQSVHYGEARDTECAVKILQEGTFDPNGNLVGPSITHHVEVPKCEGEKKQTPVAKVKVPMALPEQEKVIPVNAPAADPVVVKTQTLAPTPTPTPTPVPPPVIIPEVKKDCSEERAAKVSALYSSDSALKSLETELANLKNQNSTAESYSNDSAIIQNAAMEIEKSPTLSASLNSIIAEVYKTHQCPTNNTEGWNEFKNVSMSLYLGKEHENIDMPQIFQTQNKPAFFCGYNDSFKKWFVGTITSENKNSIIEKTDKYTNINSEAENRVYKSTSSSQGYKSYRKGGISGDALFFKLATGIYLKSVAFTQNKKHIRNYGFYSNTLVFTEEFFSQPVAPVIGSVPDHSNLVNDLTQKIESRKQELDKSVPPCGN